MRRNVLPLSPEDDVQCAFFFVLVVEFCLEDALFRIALKMFLFSGILFNVVCFKVGIFMRF